MKLFTVLATIFFANLAMACPQLSGNYQCAYDGGTEMMVISQNQRADGVTVYTMDGDELIADGNTQPLQQSDFVGNYAAVCSGAVLDVNVQGYLIDKSYKVGTMVIM